MKKKRWIILSLVILVLIILGIFSFFIYQNELAKRVEEQKKMEIERRMKKIQSHYSAVVSVSKDCDIYQKDHKRYKKVGRITKGEILSLVKPSSFSKPYFLVENYAFYIPFSCVMKTEEKKQVDTRYQHYIPFSKKIKTKDKVSLYREDQKVYELFHPIEGQVIKQDDDSYSIAYFGELFKVFKDDILEEVELDESIAVATDVPVTAYHFIYKEDDYGCTGIICHPISQIRSHFAYLKENQFFTITTKEMEEFLDGNIQLPTRSILVTIDDGDRASNIIPLLEEYEVNATLFLITAWYDPSNYQSPYLELASHTHELHEPGRCPLGQGSALKCLDKEKIVTDLKQSRSILNNTFAFCYPLYEYNDHAINAVKEAGFHLGFIGGQRRATLKSDKLLIPRITIFRNTTMDEYIEIVN